MKLKKILKLHNLGNYDHHMGTDKNIGHSYIDNFYEEVFLKYKDKSIIFLEIGLYTGESLFLWNRYFNNGIIYGVDINLNPFFKKYKNVKNLNIYEGNAYSEEIINKLPKNFDIIIDDGSHYEEDQLLCIKKYIDKLNKNGILIIEDICNEHVANNLFNYVKNNYPKYNVKIIDLRHIKQRADDILLVIENT
jgi:hypothetical protein